MTVATCGGLLKLTPGAVLVHAKLLPFDSSTAERKVFVVATAKIELPT